MAIATHAAVAEIHRITPENPVVEIAGGNKDTTTRWAVPTDATADAIDLLQSYDGLALDEAKRYIDRGRDATIHTNGYAVVVGSDIVLVIGGADGCNDMDALLERLDK